jgi:hypothetical protein
MASWSSVVALSGFDYDGGRGALSIVPRVAHSNFRCFWSNGTGWGTFSYEPAGGGTRFVLEVMAGKLTCGSCEISGAGKTTTAEISGSWQEHTTEAAGGRTTFRFGQPVSLSAGQSLRLEVRA